MEHYKRVFITLNYLTYILFGVVYLFSWNKGHEYLENIHFFLKLYVALLLLYFFHPFRKIKFDHFHREIIFHSALFLLFSISVSTLLYHLKLTKKQAKEIEKNIEKEIKLGTNKATKIINRKNINN